MASETRTFSSPTWIKTMVGVIAIGMPIATTLLLKSEGLTWLSLAFAAFSVISVAGLIEVAVFAVVINDDELRIRGMTKSRNIRRSDIARVTWESGCGVSVQLDDGAWVKLPEVGRNSQALTDSLRAWLKRGEHKT